MIVQMTPEEFAGAYAHFIADARGSALDDDNMRAFFAEVLGAFWQECLAKPDAFCEMAHDPQSPLRPIYALIWEKFQQTRN